jgi:hypothetical protein
MGKILVFINLLFALITGGFLAVDFATRTNWRQAYEALAAEQKVSRVNNEELHNTVQVVAEKLKKEEDRVKDLEKQLATEKTKGQTVLKDARSDADKNKLQAEGADVAHALAAGELATLKKETENLTKLVRQREQTIVKINAERNAAQDRMDQALHERDAAIVRSETILERLREVEKKLAAERVAGAGGGGTGPAAPSAVRNPNQPNPPPAYVRGKIEKVNAEDPSLVQLDVGTDSGLATGNTLEVYRLSPRPAYLGMVRIVNADHHTAVGRMVPAGAGAGRREVRPGDEVASSIQPPR